MNSLEVLFWCLMATAFVCGCALMVCCIMGSFKDCALMPSTEWPGSQDEARCQREFVARSVADCARRHSRHTRRVLVQRLAISGSVRRA